MKLKSLDIYGFKSFADRVHVEFDEGITAIVGPNGSGKSNVADAIRWVLGEQSAKSLRGGHMQDIIFSGTQIRKPLGFAEVSLNFDNTDRLIPIQYSEISVTRRLFRSGESEYYINRTSCRLKDILELFMDTGIGKEGYSIIGQGRIDELLSMKGEERRKVFEEAAGIVKYKTRRTESERKLSKTRDNIIRVEDILGEIENQIGPLERQSFVAKEYLQIKEQLKRYEINEFILKYQDYKSQISGLSDSTSTLEQDIEKHKSDVTGLEAKQTSLKKKLEEAYDRAKELNEARLAQAQTGEEARTQMAVIRERMEAARRDIERLTGEIAQVEEQIGHRREEKDKLTAEMQARQDAIEKLTGEMDGIAERGRRIQDRLDGVQRESTDHQQAMLDIRESIAQADNVITDYKATERNLTEQITVTEQKIEEYRQRAQGLSERKDALAPELDAIVEKLKEHLAHRDDLQDTYGASRGKLEELTEKAQEIRQKLEGHIQRLALLEDMKRNREGYFHSVKKLLDATEKGLLTGLHGTVGDLLSVPKEYETPIEVALGNAQQFVVTADEEAAKAAVSYLKQNKAGRATFLPLSSINPRTLDRREEDALGMNGCMGLGSDLVKSDRAYDEVVTYLLGRVVIVDTMDTAIAMGRRFSHGFKIVTMDGQVFHPGGSITGGSADRRSSGLLGRDRQIKELQDSIARQTGEYQGLTEQQKALRGQIAGLEERIKAAESEHKEMDVRRAEIIKQIESLAEQIRTNEEDAEKASADLGHIRITIETARSAVAEQEEKREELTRRLSDMQREMESGESGREEILKEQQAIEASLAELRQRHAVLDREQAADEQRMRHLDEWLGEGEQRIQDARNQIAAQEAAGTEGEGEITRLEQKVTDAQTEQEGSLERIRLAEEETRKIQHELDEVEGQIRTVRDAMEELIEKRHGHEVKLSRLEADLDNLQQNIWEEYELSYANALEYKDETLDPGEITQETKTLKKRLNDLGEVNVNAIEEYKRVKERYEYLTEQRDDLIQAKDDLTDLIQDLTQTMERRFIEEFAVINEHFTKVFSELFGGGKAQLVLEDLSDALECGIEIVAQPPGKKLQRLSLLSGGERALTAIAILFAILRHKPTPFCVLDEIETALDDHNVERFAQFLRDFSHQTQFVIITHRKGTMNSSHVLYGIAMEEKGVSKMVSVSLEDIPQAV